VYISCDNKTTCSGIGSASMIAGSRVGKRNSAQMEIEDGGVENTSIADEDCFHGIETFRDFFDGALFLGGKIES
jgi:hypothetical protein